MLFIILGIDVSKFARQKFSINGIESFVPTIFLSIITKPYNCETDNPPFFSGRATKNNPYLFQQHSFKDQLEF